MSSPNAAAALSPEKAALRTVAFFECAKGLVVLLAGFGLLSLVNRDVWDVAQSLLDWLHISPDHHYAQVFLALAGRLSDAKLWAIAVGTVVYSAIRFVEAYGLWRTRAWAQWLAFASGAVYLPFEIYELQRRATTTRATLFLINLAIVLYMLYLRTRRRT